MAWNGVSPYWSHAPLPLDSINYGLNHIQTINQNKCLLLDVRYLVLAIRKQLRHYLTIWVRSFWNLFIGGIWKDLKMTAEEALECCKLCTMGDRGQNSWKQNAGNSAGSKDQSQEISVGNKGCVSFPHFSLYLLHPGCQDVSSFLLVLSALSVCSCTRTSWSWNTIGSPNKPALYVEFLDIVSQQWEKAAKTSFKDERFRYLWGF